MAELRTLQGHALLLPEGSVTVGSDPENEIPIASHLGLAAHHFRLQPWQGGHFLEDTGSGLGTLVNGHPVSWKPLLNGDIITAGDLQLAYSQNHPAAHRTTPTALAPAPGIAPPLSFPSPANPVPGGFPGSLSFPEPAAPSSPALAGATSAATLAGASAPIPAASTVPASGIHSTPPQPIPGPFPIPAPGFIPFQGPPPLPAENLFPFPPSPAPPLPGAFAHAYHPAADSHRASKAHFPSDLSPATPANPPPLTTGPVPAPTPGFSLATVQAAPSAAPPVPPAWLPEDLLPDAFRPSSSPSAAPDRSVTSPLPAGAHNPSPGHRTRPANRRRRRKVLISLTATLALLGWIGHEAWQKGHLNPIRQWLPGAGGVPTAQPSPPSPAGPQNR